MDWEAWFNLGIEQFQAGDYQTALVSFDQALALNPNNSDTWTYRGVVLGCLNCHKEAIASYDQAIEIQPDYYLPWDIRGLALLNLSRYEEAIANCDKALELVPDYHQFWINRGKAQHYLGRYEEAIASYEKLPQPHLEPSYAIAWQALGHQQIQLDNYNAALVSFERAIELDSNSPNAWINRGVALIRLNRYEEALSSVERAIELDPNDHHAWCNRSTALLNLGRYQEALTSSDRALKLDSHCPTVWKNQGCILANGFSRYKEALDSFNHFLTLNSNNSAVWRYRGEVLGNLDRHEESITSFDRALELNPSDHETWKNRGDLLLTLDRYEEAIASFDHALALNPDFFDAWLIRGYALFELGRCPRDGRLSDLSCLAKAIASFDHALALNPNSDFAWANRATALWYLRRPKEAVASFDRALDLNPNIALAWKMRGIALRDLNQLEDAVESLDRALHLTDNQLPDAWADRGKIIWQLWGYEAALQSYDDGLRLLRPEMSPYQDSSSYQDSCGALHRIKGEVQYEEGLRQPNPFPYWLESRNTYQKALQFLPPEKFAEARLEVLQGLVTVCPSLGQIKESKELLREGTDLLERLVKDTPSPGRRLIIARLFESFNQLRVDELVQSGKQVEALELAEERKNVCLSWLHHGWSDTVPSPKYQNIQKLLNSRTTAIYWHVSPAAITTFILSPNKPLKTFVLRYNQPPHLLSAEATADNLTYAAVRKLQDLENWLTAWKQDYQIQEKQCWRQEMSTRLNELSKILNISEILPYLSGIDQLILLPHRDLHLLPLHALFPEQFTISYLPSAQVGLDRQQTQFKLVGKRLTTSVLNVENSQENLPYAAVESTAIAQLYPNTKHIRNSAVTQVAVTQALQSGAGIFHFSGHAEHDLNLPSESSLHLTNDERLTLRDIFELDMSSYNLVCLSACETGMTGKQGLIDEFVGLASGFLAAGTTNVVSSLWQVNDVSTAFLIIRFYENLRTCPTVAIALNQAQKWLRNLTSEEFEIVLAKFKPQIEQIFAQLPVPRRRVAEASLRQIRDRKPHPFANPYYWAAFTATGC